MNINIIYSPLGIRGGNDKTLLTETPFWGYLPKTGSKLRKGDIVLGCYAGEYKINYMGVISVIIKNSYICSKVWEKKGVNTVVNSDTNWQYIVFFESLIDLTIYNISKDKIKDAFEINMKNPTKKWSGQSAICRDNNEKINTLVNELKVYRQGKD
jgi:hypothetical protein